MGEVPVSYPMRFSFGVQQQTFYDFPGSSRTHGASDRALHSVLGWRWLLDDPHRKNAYRWVCGHPSVTQRQTQAKKLRQKLLRRQPDAAGRLRPGWSYQSRLQRRDRPHARAHRVRARHRRLHPADAGVCDHALLSGGLREVCRQSRHPLQKRTRSLQLCICGRGSRESRSACCCFSLIGRITAYLNLPDPVSDLACSRWERLSTFRWECGAVTSRESTHLVRWPSTSCWKEWFGSAERIC